MQAPYRNKEWLQKEVNRLGNLERVHRKHGWGKTTVYRWGKRLGIVAPAIDPQKKYENKDWLREQLTIGRTAKDIAEEFGVTENTVSNYLKKHELIDTHFYLTKKGQKIAEETFKNKYWLYDQLQKHGTSTKVARQVGVAPTTIQSWARKFGYETNWKSKNTLYEDKNWLINQYEQGKTVKEVSEQCSVSPRTISVANKKHGINVKKIHDKVYYPFKEKSWLVEMREKHGSGLKIAEATGYSVTSINRYIRKYELRPTQKARLVKTLNHDFFEIVDTEKKAYWLGFLMADGNVYYRKDGNYEISLKLASKDRNSVIAFKKALDMSGEVEEFERVRKGTKTFSTLIRFVSNKMAGDLASHGLIPRKSRKEVIPRTVPEELVHHYIRGYFDGDGHISKGRISIATSHFMYEQLSKIFISLGVDRDAIRRRSHPKLEVINIYREHEIKKIGPYLYKNATIYMDRKKKTFEDNNYL